MREPIMHIITGLGVGGAETMLVRLTSELATRGMPQIVVTLSGDGPRARALEASGVSVVRLNLKHPMRLPADILRLLHLVYRYRPRAIQGWLYHGDLAATLAHSFSPGRETRRLIWSIRCSDMDLERHGRTIRLCARFSAIPDIVTANSNAGAKHHCALGYRPRRLEIVDNGIDIDRWKPNPGRGVALRSDLGIAAGDLVVAHVARVDPMKDHQTLFHAVSGLERVRLLIIGAGTEALSAPPNAIAFGAREDLPDLLAAADVTVSSSAFGEGFCNALAEGMATGLVPVATDVGDARRIIGDTGSIVPPKSPLALRKALIILRQIAVEDPAGFEALKTAARIRIVNSFTLERAVEHFASLY